jgi:hypothetical protein
MAEFHVRRWLAERVGCGADDLRFAGMDSLGQDCQTVRFSLDGDRDYRVRVARRFIFGLRSRWEVTADWPSGSARTTTSDPPEW